MVYFRRFRLGLLRDAHTNRYNRRTFLETRTGLPETSDFRKRFLPLLMLILLSFAPGTATPQESDQTRQQTRKTWPYTTRGSIGLSAVFVDINGSEDKYRTDYNYLPGFALDHFTLELDDADRKNPWMDYLRLDGSGFGDSYPHQEAKLLFGKKGSYEFSGRYWKQEYFFGLPSFALGGHGDDSARRNTDLNLRLFPKRGLTLELGYFRNYNYGSSFSSREDYTNLFEIRDPRRALTQVFRVGAEVTSGPFFFSAFQHFQYFKEDPDREENRLLQTGTLPDISVSAPVRQKVPSTHLAARYAPSDRLLVEGKYLYSDGHVETSRSDILDLKFSEALTLEQLLYATSISDRPEHRADATVSISITDRLVFSNLLEYQTFDVTGNLFSEKTLQGVPPNASITLPYEASTFLNYSKLQDRPQLEFFLHSRLSFYVGYRYSTRDVQPTRDTETHETVAHTGLAGVSWRPYRGSRMSFEFEGGKADDSFTDLEPRDVRRFRLSSSFPVVPGLTISPHFLISRSENSEGEAGYESDQNQAGVEVVYAVPGDKLTLSGGYTLFDIDSLADIRYFLGGVPTEDLSRYKSSLHFVHIRGEYPATNRLRVRLGYNMIRDPDSSSYPLKRHLAEAGLRFELNERWNWDLGYQHVSYNEDLYDLQDYSANRLTVTLGWAF